MVPNAAGEAPDGIESPDLFSLATLEAERAEGYRHLNCISPLVDQSSRVPDAVPFTDPDLGSFDEIPLDSKGITQKIIRPAFIIEGVEDDGDPVILENIVAIGESGANGRRIGIIRTKGRIEI